MKDQIKKEAAELIHKLAKNLEEAHGSKDHGHSRKVHEDSKEILNQLDEKLTSVSGTIAKWKYDLCAAALQGAHEAVDWQLESGDVGVKNHALHKAMNATAKLLVEIL